MGWLAGVYRACAQVAHMSPREVDDLYAWEVASILGVGDPDGADSTGGDVGIDVGQLGGFGIDPALLVVKGD